MMTRTALITALLMALLSHGATAEEVIVTTPPASLKQWYQPQSKRQVWLHTMFRLRREMQAVGEYAAYEDRERLLKWTERLAEDYRSIGKMVPEWADELELELVDELQQSAKKGAFAAIPELQNKLGRSCAGCHREFRAVSAALYRGANFSDMVVENGETMEEVPYKEAMAALSRSMNRIKIATDDERPQATASAYAQLRTRLEDLANSCTACHDTERQRDYLFGEAHHSEFEALGGAIAAGDTRQVNRALGGVAVNLCARCHGIHRTVSDLRAFIEE